MPNPTDPDYYIEVGETTLPEHRREIETARAAMVLPIPLSAKEPRFRLTLGGRQGSRPTGIPTRYRSTSWATAIRKRLTNGMFWWVGDS